MLALIMMKNLLLPCRLTITDSDESGIPYGLTVQDYQE